MTARMPGIVTDVSATFVARMMRRRGELWKARRCSAAGSEASLLLDTKKIPYMHGAPALAQMGLLPGGAYRNMDYVQGHFRAEDTAERWCIDLMADPQTSGGLLVALPRENAEKMLEMLRAAAPDAAVIGEVIEKQDAEIIVK